MRGSSIATIVALVAGGLSFVTPAAAGSRDPLVSQGVGPDDAPAAQPGPTRVAASGLGGGFLELLATGRDPTPDVYAPRGQRMAPQYEQAAPGMPVQQRAYTNEPSRAPPPAPAPIQRASVDPSAMVGVHRAIDPKYLRQEVDYASTQPAGSIIVDTPNRYLYYVLGNGRAMRYGIGVGRPGFEWAGMKTVSRKAEWPDWTPPPEMLLRRPELPRHMAGGPENPLGARAMYLGSSLYRIHGTNEPWTIGQNVSSGCIRLMNEDVTDLYERVKVGTRVQVI